MSATVYILRNRQQRLTDGAVVAAVMGFTVTADDAVVNVVVEIVRVLVDDGGGGGGGGGFDTVVDGTGTGTSWWRC